MALIVGTLDNKMLQDTQVGMIITSRRPHVVQENGFVEQRLNKTEYRKKELEVIVPSDAVPDGLTDVEFGKIWNRLRVEGQVSEDDRKRGVKVVLAEFRKINKIREKEKKEDDLPSAPPL